jgi:beta-aspartyl-peptidase (threonine type)
MKKQILFCFLTLSIMIACNPQETKTNKMPVTGKIAIALHGGAGNIEKMNLSEEEKKAYLHVMDSALSVGYEFLKTGGSSVDAVEKVLCVLEDSPLFNAGKGSVFSHDGKIEMDAAIMDGKTLDAGCLAGVRHIKNPISLAKLIMRKSNTVFLHGEGAEDFAKEKGMSLVDTSYFFTQERWDQLQNALKKDSGMELDHGNEEKASGKNEKTEGKYGTVGCVAMDQNGNLAAGTSTGGLANKKYNRIGDSPIIGAGTYAENLVGAISCTGRGEDFIKNVIAYDIASQIKYQNKSLFDAVSASIQTKLKSNGGRGGCIAMDHEGNVVFNFTTTGMFRGSIDTNGKKYTAIYR